MKVLLIQPPTHSSLGLQAFMLPEPLGLEAVAGSLIQEHEVRILDMRLEAFCQANEAAYSRVFDSHASTRHSLIRGKGSGNNQP